ncbi:hypothetical protein G7Y89_g1933 [Cudoniella acicularis]|uniref:Uncharacterized protein n=1 Tax=Cudoniella acicularis TaxID=354080 RepID=A0A8H4RVD5_9HELO|nr:hypothetical protein G7Y89_g1933 [Cudoniella acicularis]
MAGGAGNQRARQGAAPPSRPPPQQAPAPQQHQQAQGSDGKYDGPGEARQNPFGKGMGCDPARSSGPAATGGSSVITNRRVELPSAAYRLDGGSVSLPISNRLFLLLRVLHSNLQVAVLKTINKSTYPKLSPRVIAEA